MVCCKSCPQTQWWHAGIIVFHTAFPPWGDRQRDVIPTRGLFCCTSRCQMPDPTAALRQLLCFSIALAMLMMQPPHVCRQQRERSSLHHRGLTRLEASRQNNHLSMSDHTRVPPPPVITEPCQITRQASTPAITEPCQITRQARGPWDMPRGWKHFQIKGGLCDT